MGVLCIQNENNVNRNVIKMNTFRVNQHTLAVFSRLFHTEIGSLGEKGGFTSREINRCFDREDQASGLK